MAENGGSIQRIEFRMNHPVRERDCVAMNLAAQKRGRQPFSETFELRSFIFWVNISVTEVPIVSSFWGSYLFLFRGGARKFLHPSICPFSKNSTNFRYYDTVSQRGEERGEGNLIPFTLPSTLSPAFAEAASRRQAPAGEGEYCGALNSSMARACNVSAGG